VHAQSAAKKFRYEHNLLRAQLSAADSAAVRVDSAPTEPKIFISTATFAAAAFLDRLTGEGRRSTRSDTTFTMCVLFTDFKGGQSNNERLASMADLEGPVTWLHVGGPTSDPHSLASGSVLGLASRGHHAQDRRMWLGTFWAHLGTNRGNLNESHST
jgi:hypothetical protein